MEGSQVLLEPDVEETVGEGHALLDIEFGGGTHEAEWVATLGELVD